MSAVAPNPLSSPRWLIPTGVFLATFLVVAATINDYGVTLDEPPYFYASDLHTQWLLHFGKNVLDGDSAKSLLDENIKAAWHWDPFHVPHPTFSRIVSGITKTLTVPWVDKFVAYRLGPALFFAALVTCMYVWMTDLFGRATGLFSALALVVIPNLFAFAHIAVTDMPLAFMWFFTVYCFWRGLESWRWSLVLGAVWGLALATKFPALLIPVPLLLWAHLCVRRDYRNNLFSMIFLGPIIAVATQPYLWHEPALRFLEFLFEGVSRGYRAETNYFVFFLNQTFYTASLPRYYPFFVVGVTTPEVILLLGCVGALSVLWGGEQRATLALLLINVAFILALGLMPGAVLHDGVRQLLSALPFLAALAAGGFYLILRLLIRLAEQSQRLPTVRHLRVKIAGATLVAFLFTPLLDLWLCHPYQLSFYNRLVGGIRGAYAMGLEITYFMEAISPSFIKALNEQLPRDSVINASSANFMFTYYQQEGRLRSDLKITDSKSFNYLILFNRRSVLPPREQNLLNGPTPPYLSVTVAGVPLVSVFEVKKPG